MRNILLTLAGLIVLGTLAACGQKGPLVPATRGIVAPAPLPTGQDATSERRDAAATARPAP